MKTSAQLNKNMMNGRTKDVLYNDILDMFRKVFEKTGHPFNKRQGE